jgi:hypothetical protein
MSLSTAILCFAVASADCLCADRRSGSCVSCHLTSLQYFSCACKTMFSHAPAPIEPTMTRRLNISISWATLNGWVYPSVCIYLSRFGDFAFLLHPDMLKHACECHPTAQCACAAHLFPPHINHSLIPGRPSSSTATMCFGNLKYRKNPPTTTATAARVTNPPKSKPAKPPKPPKPKASRNRCALLLGITGWWN